MAGNDYCEGDAEYRTYEKLWKKEHAPRPILDRGVRYDRTTLEDAARYALISLDSTMRSNVTVGPPIDLAVYVANEFELTRYRRLGADDPDLRALRLQWEQSLRRTVQELPPVRFEKPTPNRSEH